MSNVKRKSFNDQIGLSLPDTGEEFLKMIEDNSEFEEIPGREHIKSKFIEFCKRFATSFELDINVKENKHETLITIEFDAMLVFAESKETLLTIFQIADEIEMVNLKKGKTTLILTYFTHQLYLNGKPMRKIKGVAV